MQRTVDGDRDMDAPEPGLSDYQRTLEQALYRFRHFPDREEMAQEATCLYFEHIRKGLSPATAYFDAIRMVRQGRTFARQPRHERRALCVLRGQIRRGDRRDKIDFRRCKVPERVTNPWPMVDLELDVGEFLAQRPWEDQLIIWLRRLGHSSAGIARLLGRSDTYVKKRLYVMRQQLLELWREQ